MQEMVNEKDPERIAALVKECAGGNSGAQYRLYRQYSKAMFNIAYRMTNSREDAEDVLQESFLECFRNIGSFRAESTFGAWLKTIVINKSINHLRRKNVTLVYQETLPDVTEDEEHDQSYNIPGIIKCIEQLPDGYRIVLTLYLLEGYDHSEIAGVLGISESTSKSQYSRAKSRLRNLLRNYRNG